MATRIPGLSLGNTFTPNGYLYESDPHNARLQNDFWASRSMLASRKEPLKAFKQLTDARHSVPFLGLLSPCIITIVSCQTEPQRPKKVCCLCARHEQKQLAAFPPRQCEKNCLNKLVAKATNTSSTIQVSTSTHLTLKVILPLNCDRCCSWHGKKTRCLTNS